MSAQITKIYKEPVFLFTSSSLRFAAWAGWYSALGDKENTEKCIHQAHSEWVKELAANRRYPFLRYHNDDIWKHVPPERLAQQINRFLDALKTDIKKYKLKSETEPA